MRGIQIFPEQLQQMLEHVAHDAPIEACGLLGGTNSRVQQVIPVKNAAESQVRYRMDPAEQVGALFGFEERGIELVAIYHSHPSGPTGPSTIDIREDAYPEALQLIWFLETGIWVCRAYRYSEGAAVEVPMSVSSDDEEHGGQDQ